MLPPPLIALTPGDLERSSLEAFLPRLREALDAGLPGLLVREPHLSDRDLAVLFEAALAARAPGTWTALHDRVHLAAALGADAVHLGFRSLAPADVRAGFGERLTIGLSTHAGDDPAAWSAADYLFHGPVHATPAKAPAPYASAPAGAGLPQPIGFDGLRRAVRRADRPLWGLGGLAPRDVAPALLVGAQGVAVLSGILGGRGPGEATRAYLEALQALREPAP